MVRPRRTVTPVAAAFVVLWAGGALAQPQAGPSGEPSLQRRKKKVTPAPSAAAGAVLETGLPAAPMPAPPARVPDTVPLVPRPREAPREALVQPLAALEKAAGTTAGAHVMAAVQTAGYAKMPRSGRGTIKIIIEEDGHVSRVTSTSPSWENVARSIHTSVQGRRFPVPKGARGVTITIAVRALYTHTPIAFAPYVDEPTDTRGGHATGPKMPGVSATHIPESLKGSSPSDSPQGFVVDPRAFLPLPRHLVQLEFVREEPR
jgi:hypothetical protein